MKKGIRQICSGAVVALLLVALVATITPTAAASTVTMCYTITNSSTSGKWFTTPYERKDSDSATYLRVQLAYGNHDVRAQVWTANQNQTVNNTVLLYNCFNQDCLIKTNTYSNNLRSARLQIYVPAKTKVRFWWSPDSVIERRVYFMM